MKLYQNENRSCCKKNLKAVILPGAHEIPLIVKNTPQCILSPSLWKDKGKVNPEKWTDLKLECMQNFKGMSILLTDNRKPDALVFS